MAQKVIRISDLTNKEIPEGQGLKVRISYEDARRGVLELDVLEEEVTELVQHARKVARRGRRPKQVS